MRTMRAVSIEGGRDQLVERNLAERCDTGVLLERDATATRVVENWLHDCRVGVLTWGDAASEISHNAISEPRDHAVVADSEGLGRRERPRRRHGLEERRVPIPRPERRAPAGRASRPVASATMSSR